MMSTNPYDDFKRPVYYIHANCAEYREPKRELTVAGKRLAAKESQREFLRRKKR